MLQHAIQIFDFPLLITEAVRSEIIAYMGLLRTKGYIARQFCVAHEDASRHTITVSAIACWPDCLSRAAADGQITEALNDIVNSHHARDVIQYELAIGTSDETYASGPPWTHLRLVCDCILGISPLRTTDGKYVPRFLLALDDELAEELWAWDVEYSGIYACWLAGGTYEQWAEREMSDSTSQLNVAGRTLAAKLSRAIGCPVDYCQYDQPNKANKRDAKKGT